MPRKITPSLKEVLEDYLRSRHHLSATLGNDRSVLQRFFRGIGEDSQIGNVTPAQVERWPGSPISNAGARWPTLI
jgi:hypothetical protein